MARHRRRPVGVRLVEDSEESFVRSKLWTSVTWSLELDDDRLVVRRRAHALGQHGPPALALRYGRGLSVVIEPYRDPYASARTLTAVGPAGVVGDGSRLTVRGDDNVLVFVSRLSCRDWRQKIDALGSSVPELLAQSFSVTDPR